MPRQRFTIENMPLRSGLATAGQQGTIAENQLWQAENCASMLDGTIAKRPGLWQWGQVLKYPVGTDDVSFYEDFASLDLWTTTDGHSDIAESVRDGKLIVTVKQIAGVPEDILGRGVEGQQGDSDDADFSWRLSTRFINVQALSEYIVSAKARTADDPYALRIRKGGIDYWTGSWTEWYAYDFEDKPVATVELRFDADGNATLYLNETAVGGTVAVSAMTAYTAFTVGTYMELTFRSMALLTDQYTIYIFDLMFDGSATAPFTASRLGAGTDYKNIGGGSSVDRSLLVSSDKVLYWDHGLRHEWSALMELSGSNVTFSQFGDELIIFDADDNRGSKVYRWGGQDTPVHLDDAAAVRFGTEHRTRIFAAGDKNFPLRLYFTASRQPNVWFSPDTDADGQEEYNEVIDAGYMVIPGKRGDEIVAVYGEFYGSCIVCTNRGIWRITGSSPASYNIENVNQDSGAAAQAGIERLGNDLWMVGRQGVTTIQTVQQFGDIQSQMPSAPVANLWTPGLSNTYKVDQYQLWKSSLAWNPTTSNMLFAFAKQGASDVSSILSFSAATGQWLGPWESDTSFVEGVEIGNPVQQVVMHGTTVGKVAIQDLNNKMDFTDTITMTIESPYLNGRSLDPSLTAQIKTWKVLRLYFQGGGDWDLDVKWQVDDQKYVSRSKTQNVFDLPRLGTDWRLNVDPDGMIHSNQLIGVIEIPLDVRGRYLKFEISTDDTNDNEDFVFQGYQVEFTANGLEREQEK